VITVLLLITALSGRLAGLANAASLIMLCIFTLVNLALWRLKKQESAPPQGPAMPRALPLLGALLCAGFVVWELTAAVGLRVGR
jgi:amino acid transporter